jgi:uncharacterized protein (DUF952 family)
LTDLPGDVAVLYHLALPVDWAAAVAAGRYEMSTRGRSLAEEGFIHCSLPHQVRGVAEAFYSDVAELVLLVIDPDRLDAPVRVEAPEPGAPAYPHIYGALPVCAVRAAHRLTHGPDGRLALPELGVPRW